MRRTAPFNSRVKCDIPGLLVSRVDTAACVRRVDRTVQTATLTRPSRAPLPLWTLTAEGSIKAPLVLQVNSQACVYTCINTQKWFKGKGSFSVQPSPLVASTRPFLVRPREGPQPRTSTDSSILISVAWEPFMAIGFICIFPSSSCSS